jgi:RTX calcium-binding nonapeptide repeat (4 copies)
MSAGRSNVATMIVLMLSSVALLPLGTVPAATQPACDDLGQTENTDILTGTQGADVICGLGGEDQIQALGGVDLVFGGPGLDTVSGGEDEDYLHGGREGASLNGGPGADACVNGTRVSCFPEDPPDPNDAGGILDVKRVEVGAGNRWVWNVTTRGRWSLRRLWDDGYLIIYLDTRDNQKPDFYLLGRSTGGRMRGTLFRDGPGRDARIGGVKVGHPDKRTARFLFDLGRIDVEPGRDYIRWSAQSILVNAVCSKSCFDRVTNEGALPMPVD